MADATTHHGSERVRRAIEDTRRQMDATVDGLTGRLAPDHILDRAWGRLKGGDGGLRQMMRDHPIPVALVGIGLGWLAAEQASESRRSRREPEWDDELEGEDFEEEWEPASLATGMEHEEDEHAGLPERARGAASAMKESVKEGVASARGRASSMRERASGAVGEAVETAKEKVRRGRRSSMEGMRSGAHRAKAGFQSMMEHNPLALGAIAFGLGMAGGVSAPSTPVEDRALGRTSDTLKKEAKRIGTETMKEVRPQSEAPPAP
ncbi:MAG TPA: DUF3618 domain-containing protein [Longimicrobiales bacterium]|nr:DUF3618 domain-containing protein [Longimicrobiales bacterium]